MTELPAPATPADVFDFPLDPIGEPAPLIVQVMRTRGDGAPGVSFTHKAMPMPGRTGSVLVEVFDTDGTTLLGSQTIPIGHDPNWCGEINTQIPCPEPTGNRYVFKVSTMLDPKPEKTEVESLAELIEEWNIDHEVFYSDGTGMAEWLHTNGYRKLAV